MAKTAKIGLFPGTFDPVTNGHLDVIRRGCGLFDELVVAIARNPGKSPLFSLEERLAMMRSLLGDIDDGVVKVESYDGLTVDFARAIGATAILRGLRNVSDLNYEFQLALTNRAVADIETTFIMTGESFAFASSTLIKQIAAVGDVDSLHRLLPPLVLEQLKAKKKALGERIAGLHRDGFQE